MQYSIEYGGDKVTDSIHIYSSFFFVFPALLFVRTKLYQQLSQLLRSALTFR